MSKYELREELHRAVMRDLLGPAESLDEEFWDTTVRDRYLVGKLAPPNLVMDPGDIDDLNEGSDSSSDDGAAEDGSLQAESLIPSSFGMTFCVDADTKTLEIEASWGRYLRLESEIHVTEEGRARRVWKRNTAGGKITINLDVGNVASLAPDEAQPEVSIQGIIRPATSQGEKIITLFLINGQAAQERNQDEAWLFQPEFLVKAEDGAPIFRRRPSGDSNTDDEERAALEMLYRDHVEFAVGHGVSVHAMIAEGVAGRATSIKTAVIPSYDVPMTEAPTEVDIIGLSELELDMKTISELDKDILTKSLSVLSREYSTWIDTQRERIKNGELPGFEDEGHKALVKCGNTLERLKEGINVLDQNGTALEAFRFANKAMWKQRVRGIYSLRKRRGEEVTLEDIDEPKNRSWRPFQLAFQLLAIPSLTDPTHPDRADTSSLMADLLWFPTGGGKTEAYLGVAAYAMGIRRLQGNLGGFDGKEGLSVIMRYTLRLLTIQQFQRASTLLCAMEVLRREALENGDEKWGNKPFRIGLWVGSGVTPNTTMDAGYAIQNAHGDSWQRTGSGTPAQLTSCPWCGQEINPGRDIKVYPFKGNVGRTLMFCSDRYGRCEFTQSKAPGEGLPVVVVDEEIYRLLPR